MVKILIDLIALLGCSLMAAGLFLRFGLAMALIVVGLLLLLWALLAAWSHLRAH